MKENSFIHNEYLKMENRVFWGQMITSSLGYLGITLWLNHIRTTAPLWFVWVLIIIQFLLYFSIFIRGYYRSNVFGWNKNIAFVVFVALAILGRVNDWELLIIPLTVLTMLLLSGLNKKISKKITE